MRGVEADVLRVGQVVVPSTDVLDRIDEIVPPGITLDAADGSFTNPALEPAARRRQH